MSEFDHTLTIIEEQASSMGLDPDTVEVIWRFAVSIYMRSQTSAKKFRMDKAELPKLFQEFYQNYPRKVGLKDAYRAWSSHVKPDERHVVAQRAKAYSAMCDAEGKETKYIPYPARWLNQGRWNDDELQSYEVGQVTQVDSAAQTKVDMSEADEALSEFDEIERGIFK